MHVLRAADPPGRAPGAHRAARRRPRRGGDGVPASLPQPGDPVRRAGPRRHANGGGAEGAALLLRPARAGHASAHPVSRQAREPQSGALAMTLAEPLLFPTTDAELHGKIASVTWRQRGWAYRVALAGSGLGTLWLAFCVSYTVARGIGVWGNQIPVAWAFGIINFVWWIGIGHAGTFISAILYLFEQPW